MVLASPRLGHCKAFSSLGSGDIGGMILICPSKRQGIRLFGVGERGDWRHAYHIS